MLQGSYAIGVLLHPLKQDKHLTVRSLWEQVHCHSLDWMEWGAFYSVRWGPAEVHKVAHGCPGVTGNIQEPLDVLSFPDGQNHLRM